MPAGVGYQRRKNDDPDPFGNHETEQKTQRGDEQRERQQLPELDADVEREQRHEQVRPGELQRLPQGERESESMNQTEPESDHPSAPEAVLEAAPDDVFERHIYDGDRDQRFNERRKP